MTTPANLSEHIRAHLRLGLPLIGSHLAQMAIGLTDTVMLGWYDVEALAAMVLGSTFFTVLFLFGSGFAFAVSPLVASAAETDDELRIRRVTRMGLWISVGFALAVLPLLWFSGTLLRLAGQDAGLSAFAQDYLRIAGLGIVPALAVMVLKSHLAALERTRVQLLVTLGAVAANALVNYVLIFGNWGAPELGIRGAAIASLGVHVLSLGLLALYATRAFPSHQLFHRLWRVDGEALREVAKMGGHIALTVLAEVGLFALSALLVGLLGIVPLAAHGVVMQITSFSFMVPLGLANAATVRAGRAFGRRDGAALRKGAFAAHLLGLGAALIAIIAFLTLPELLVGLYVDPDDPLRADIIAAGRVLLAMAALFQFFDATQVIASSLLRGMQDTRGPMLIAAASYWLVGAPSGWFFGLHMELGAAGVWLGLVLGLGAAAVLLSVRFWGRSARV